MENLQLQAEQQAQLQQQQCDQDLLREARAVLSRIRERRGAQQVINDEEERQILDEHERELHQYRCAFSSGSRSRNNQENQRTLQSYQREANRTHQQEDIEAHTSRGSWSANNQLCSEEEAAADYERNCHNENQLSRQEEAQQHREQAVNPQRTHNAANPIQLRRQEEAQQHREQAVNPQRTHNAANPIPPQTIPKGQRPYHEPQGGPERHYLGPMNVECNHCHALHFDSEKKKAHKFYMSK